MTRRFYPFDVAEEAELEEISVPATDDGDGLPKDVVHGSMRAVRLGCTCKRCMERKRRANRRGRRWY